MQEKHEFGLVIASTKLEAKNIAKSKWLIPFKKKFTNPKLIDFNIILLKSLTMNIYLFWILFLALWAIVPLMIIKGRVDEEPKIQTSPKVKEKKKGWFN